MAIQYGNCFQVHTKYVRYIYTHIHMPHIYIMSILCVYIYIYLCACVSTYLYGVATIAKLQDGVHPWGSGLTIVMTWATWSTRVTWLAVSCGIQKKLPFYQPTYIAPSRKVWNMMFLLFLVETHLVDFPATAELVYKRVSLVEMSREPSVLGTDSLGKTCILIRRDFVSPLSGFLGIMGPLVSFRWNFHSKYPVSWVTTARQSYSPLYSMTKFQDTQVWGVFLHLSSIPVSQVSFLWRPKSVNYDNSPSS